LEPEQILKHLLVNQAAPAILMSAFIRLTREFSGNRRIINISSGAGKHAYAGWAMYCATKAGLNMMTQCIAAEQQYRDDGVTIYAVSPGKIETDMQVRIRASDPRCFPAREDFIKAKRQGKLLSTDVAARKLLDLDRRGNLKNGGLYDLRETVVGQGDGFA
jgi:benzil reductase ((S)-benzoin forming)